jgi:hypothetical protein
MKLALDFKKKKTAVNIFVTGAGKGLLEKIDTAHSILEPGVVI